MMIDQLGEVEAQRLTRGAVHVSSTNEILTPPIRLTSDNVIYWSEHYKRLEGVKEGSAIKTKAKAFIDQNCISWNKYTKEFECLPLKGNHTKHRMVKQPDGSFDCTCQFYNKTVKNSGQPNLLCSHVLALYLYLKLKRWNGEDI